MKHLPWNAYKNTFPILLYSEPWKEQWGWGCRRVLHLPYRQKPNYSFIVDINFLRFWFWWVKSRCVWYCNDCMLATFQCIYLVLGLWWKIARSRCRMSWKQTIRFRLDFAAQHPKQPFIFWTDFTKIRLLGKFYIPQYLENIAAELSSQMN